MLTLCMVEFAYTYKDALYRELNSLLEQGRRAILIVPEQQTLSAEKEAAYRLPPDASLLFEVTNFTRLANTVFRTVGGLADTYSTPMAKSLVMWRALTQTADVRKQHNGKEIGAADVKQALAAVSDMQSMGIPPEVLADAAASESSRMGARLREKLQSLSVISAAFKALHNERYADVGDDVESLARALKNHADLLKDTVVYIDGFTSFTQPQYNVLRQLLPRCDTTVFLTLPKADGHSFTYTETKRTSEELLHLSDLASAPKRRIFGVGNTQIKSEGLYEISRALWQSSPNIDNNSLQNISNHLQIFVSDTPFDSAEFLASYIQKEIQSGAKYNDFAIVMRQADMYRGIIDTALKEAGIPYFMSEKRDITAFEAVKLIDMAFRIIENGYKREDVLAYAKCGLSGISPEDCDLFEIYTERWRINGTHFIGDDIWNMNPDGYTDRWRKDAEAELHRIDNTRRQLLMPLSDFAARQKSCNTVKEHACALLQFLLDLHLEDALAKRAERLRSMGEGTTAEENDRLFSLLTDTLQQIVDGMGDAMVQARQFHTLLMIAFSSVSIGHIPSYADCVTVGSADMLRLTDKRHVVLFGVHDGEFPAAASDNAWFTEQEKRALFSLGILPEPCDHVGNARELFAFSRAFSAASDKVTLMYCRRSAAFKPLRPATVIEHIMHITKQAVQPVDTADLSCNECVYSPALAMTRLPVSSPTQQQVLRASLADTSFASSLLISTKSILNNDLVLSADMCRTLYGGDIALTQSRLESYLSCPLSHFLTYVLRLKENRRAAFDAINIGTFVHAILENYFREKTADGDDFSHTTAEECRNDVRRIAAEYIRRVSSDTLQNTVRLKHFLHRLTKAATVVTESLVEEMKHSGYRPRFFELKIEKNNPLLPSPVLCRTSDAHHAYIYGTIDRVDTFIDQDQVYVRVIDYKTGTKTFSPRDLDEGKNLQMFLYLRSVLESTHFHKALGATETSDVLPGGVMYINTKLTADPLANPEESSVTLLKKGQKVHGMLLDDSHCMDAINPNFLPIRRKNDGTPYKNDADRLYTREGWAAICDKVTSHVVATAERLKSGIIAADPMKKGYGKGTCDTCPFSPICRHTKAT